MQSVTAITLFVDDLAVSREFYDRVFAKPVLNEDDDAVAYRFENTIVNLLRRGAAPELVEPAPIAPSGSGPRVLLTTPVEDVDATCAELERSGVALLNGPIDRPWGPRTAAFADPSGHVWEIAA